MKKNDLAYLLDLKIDIQTKNDSHYQELALLFDSTRYLNMLTLLRSEYSVNELFTLIEYQKYDVDYFCGDMRSINLKKYPTIKKLEKSLPDFYQELIGESDPPLILEVSVICCVTNSIVLHIFVKQSGNQYTAKW